MKVVKKYHIENIRGILTLKIFSSDRERNKNVNHINDHLHLTLDG